MRPSEKPGVVAILDTLGECKVVNDAFDDPDFLLYPKSIPTNEEIANGLRHRFHTQAMHLPAGDAFATEYNFVAQPEFDVLRNDGYFVLNAAGRILDQKKLSDRIFNGLTGRTKAAKTIVRLLEYRND